MISRLSGFLKCLSIIVCLQLGVACNTEAKPVSILSESIARPVVSYVYPTVSPTATTAVSVTSNSLFLSSVVTTTVVLTNTTSPWMQEPDFMGRVSYFPPPTGQTQSGQSIRIELVPTGWTHKAKVIRGDEIYWLTTHNAYGCEGGLPSYDTFGCYFGVGGVIDLDADGEPEIILDWEQGGSGGYKSVHIYKWDGGTYQNIGEFFEMGLQTGFEELNGDENIEMILTYYVSTHFHQFPWINIYNLSGGELVSVNEKYPEFYGELLVYYQLLLPEVQKTEQFYPEALETLKTQIETVKTIIHQ